MPERHGKALRSKSRAAAGPVVSTGAALFGHGGVVGVSNATGLREACAAVNGFLRSRFPKGTWTSIAVLFNPRMGLHRDNSEHARAL